MDRELAIFVLARFGVGEMQQQRAPRTLMPRDHLRGFARRPLRADAFTPTLLAAGVGACPARNLVSDQGVHDNL